jgi:hypothetical protein
MARKLEVPDVSFLLHNEKSDTIAKKKCNENVWFIRTIEDAMADLPKAINVSIVN